MEVNESGIGAIQIGVILPFYPTPKLPVDANAGSLYSRSMTPRMQEVLYRLSLCYDPTPDVVFEKVVQEISAYYGGTMAMINLTEGDRQVARSVARPHRLLKRVSSLPLEDTY
jgi:hypothetical protein